MSVAMLEIVEAEILGRELGLAGAELDEVLQLLEEARQDYMLPGEPYRVSRAIWDHRECWRIEVLSDCGQFWLHVHASGQCWHCGCTDDACSPSCIRNGVGCSWTNEHRNWCTACNEDLGLDDDEGDSNREIANAALEDDFWTASAEPDPETIRNLLTGATPRDGFDWVRALADLFASRIFVEAEREALPWKGGAR